MSDLYLAIGERIREAREDRGWTQSQLGEAIGYSQATIGNYELGRRHVSIDDLYKIAEALGKPYAYFLGADRQYEEQARREAEQKTRSDLASFVGVRMLPVLRSPVSNGSRLTPADLMGTIPVPREFGQRADAVFQVKTIGAGAGVRTGDHVFIRRENSGHPGQIVLAEVEGCTGLVTCSPEHGYLWTETGRAITARVLVVGEFCGLYSDGPSTITRESAESSGPLWDDLSYDDRRQVEQFIEFLRARRTANQ